jgi:glycopeptide antibiotics resistance protein
MITHRNLRQGFRACTLVFAAIVAWFAFRPTAEVDAGLPWDKANHALAFMVLTVLAGLGWPRLSAAFLVLIMVVAGVGIELVQGLSMIGRDADVLDVVADTFGTLIGLLIIAVVGKRWSGR